MILRDNQPDQPGRNQSPPGNRLNLLLSHRMGSTGVAAASSDNSAFQQLPRLLEPLGIRSIHAPSGEDAASVIVRQTIHIAVIDFAVPLSPKSSATGEGGARILQLLRRLDQPPPTVVVRPPQPTARENVRGLSDALREGAFAVLDHPLNLEVMLEVMRRILRRHYSNLWPE